MTASERSCSVRIGHQYAYSLLSGKGLIVVAQNMKEQWEKVHGDGSVTMVAGEARWVDDDTIGAEVTS